MADASLKRKRGSADDIAAQSSNPDDEQTLVLARDHSLSVELSCQCKVLATALPHGVEKCEVVSPGITAAWIRSGKSKGFGCATWVLHIGGLGVSDNLRFYRT
jgi:hypothetical protein